MRIRAQLWSKQRDVLVVKLKRQQGKEINKNKQTNPPFLQLIAR